MEEIFTLASSQMMLVLTSRQKIAQEDLLYTTNYREKFYLTLTKPSSLLLLSSVCLVRNLSKKTRITTETRPMKIKLLSSVNKLTQRLENANLHLEFSILMRTLVTTWKVSRLFAKTVLLTLLMEVLTKPQPFSLASSLLHLFSLLHTYFTFAPSLIVH